MPDEDVEITVKLALLKFGEESWYVRVPKNAKIMDIVEAVKQWAKPLIEAEDVAIS